MQLAQFRKLALIGALLCFAAPPWADCKTEVWFVPNLPGQGQSQTVTDMVVGEIGNAQKQILVQAYDLTSQPIAAALIQAHRRGLAVQILQDAKASNGKGALKGEMLAAGVPYATIKKYAISHSKIIIIDGQEVLEGSFNWTASAQAHNAENCVRITEEPETVAKYIANFQARWAERDQ